MVLAFRQMDNFTHVLLPLFLMLHKISNAGRGAWATASGHRLDAPTGARAAAVPNSAAGGAGPVAAVRWMARLGPRSPAQAAQPGAHPPSRPPPRPRATGCSCRGVAPGRARPGYHRPPAHGHRPGGARVRPSAPGPAAGAGPQAVGGARDARRDHAVLRLEHRDSHA